MLREENRIIGGPGKIVEIDESLFSKRKYHVGRLVKKKWIVGGIDTESRECFFVEVISRDKETLENIITRYVRPGSIIYSDCWPGYVDLNDLGYIHKTVNHKRNWISRP